MYSYKEIFRMTLPLMFGTFVHSVVVFTDAVFVSELGDTAIGASGNASLMFMAFFMFCRGLGDGTQIAVARLDGQGEDKKIGETVFHAQVYQAIISGLLFSILFLFGDAIVYSFSKNQDVAELMIDYLNARGWGLILAAQHMILASFFIGIGKTRVIFISALIIAGSNIFLDYCFIFGNLGFPELGMIGAPLASSISEGLGFVYLLVYLLTKSSYKKYAYSFFQKINLRAHFAIIKLSFPLMLQGVIALSTWLVFFTLIEHSGKGPLETAHNIRYMYFLAFVPIFGFAASTKTIVSNLVGQGRQDLIKKVQNRIIFMSVLSMVIIFHGAVLYPEFLIRLVDQNPNLDPVVLADSVYILRFISGSILIYSIAVIYFNTIAGLGKTTVYFFIEVFSILLYLVGCYLFIVLWKWDIKMVWWVEYIYFLCFLIFSVLYLYFYRRNLIKNE